MNLDQAHGLLTHTTKHYRNPSFSVIFFFLIDLFLKFYLFFFCCFGVFVGDFFFLKFQIHDLGLWVFLKLDIGSCVTLIVLCFLCWVVKNMLKFGSLGFRIIGFFLK